MIQNYGILNFSGAGPLPPDAVIEGIDLVDDGTVYEPLSLAFLATNYGGAGEVLVYWRLYDYNSNLLNSGSENFNMGTGTDTYYFEGIVYPPAPGAFNYAEVQILGGSTETSNTFEITS